MTDAAGLASFGPQAGRAALSSAGETGFSAFASTEDLTSLETLISRWDDACLAAALFALDPSGFGAVHVRARPGPARERWLSWLTACLKARTLNVRRLPFNVSDAALLGGLDLAATLKAGRPVYGKGILAEAEGGVLVVPMAERLTPEQAGRLTSAWEAGGRFALVLLDESIDAEEAVPLALQDRAAFTLDLDDMPLAIVKAETDVPAPDSGADAAKTALADPTLEALCAGAAGLGIQSARAPLLAVRAAKAHAALHGRQAVAEEDAVAAARLVLGPKARQMPDPQENAEEPESEEAEAPPEPDDPPPDASPPDESKTEDQGPPPDLAEAILAAAAASLPDGLLAALARRARGAVAGAAGKSGAKRSGSARGRMIGTRKGVPRSAADLDIYGSLRAAAPWQKLRIQIGNLEDSAAPQRFQIHMDDLQIRRRKERTETTTIFVVDASGSAAQNRLAEAKGAVTLLLSDCYVRRDEVALIAYRRAAAELVLPPTRAIARARRALTGLPGGGGTPLAAGIDAAVRLALSVRRQGRLPMLIFLTDGRPNVTRSGMGGRAQAREDAEQAARAVRAMQIPALMIDSSPRKETFAEGLSREMGAEFVHLPNPRAGALDTAIRGRMPRAGPGPAAP